MNPRYLLEHDKIMTQRSLEHLQAENQEKAEQRSGPATTPSKEVFHQSAVSQASPYRSMSSAILDELHPADEVHKAHTKNPTPMTPLLQGDETRDPFQTETTSSTNDHLFQRHWGDSVMGLAGAWWGPTSTDNCMSVRLMSFYRVAACEAFDMLFICVHGSDPCDSARHQTSFIIPNALLESLARELSTTLFLTEAQKEAVRAFCTKENEKLTEVLLHPFANQGPLPASLAFVVDKVKGRPWWKLAAPKPIVMKLPKDLEGLKK